MKKPQKIDLSDIDSLTFELANKAQAEKKKPEHYINNKELQEEYVKYHKMKLEALERGEGPPPLTDAIGRAILSIATRRAFSRNFVGYTQHWKEEMIGDAIEACIRYAHNYNPEKYNNPFAYITQIVNNAMANRINREKTQTYIKYKAFDNLAGFHGELDDNVNEEDLQGMDIGTEVYSKYLAFIHEFEEKRFKKPEKVEEEDEENQGVTKFLE